MYIIYTYEHMGQEAPGEVGDDEDDALVVLIEEREFDDDVDSA